MLHLVIATHGAETCPAAHAFAREIALPGLQKLTAGLPDEDMTVVGGWADMPGHALYLIIDAPNAHRVSQLAMGLGMAKWSTVNVRPVLQMGELQQALANMA